MQGLAIVALGSLVLVVSASAANGPKSSSMRVLRDKVLQSARPSVTANDEDGGGGGDADEKDSIRERGMFELSIAAAPASNVPSRGLLAAVSAAENMRATGGRWAEVTARPFINDPIPRGANYGVGHHYVTGRMTAFTSSGGTLYAGAASGGVWRTTNLGGHWSPVDGGLPRLPVGALMTDRDGSIIVGTGEANNASENQYGVGTYRLRRGSSTWHRVGGDELDGAGVYRISSIHGYLYAATSHGLFRRAESASDSRHWRVVLKPDPNPFNSPYRTSFITDVIAVPGTNGRKILAADGWAGYSGQPSSVRYNGFYVGTGGNGSFHRIRPHGDIDRHAIGRTSFSTSHGWLYAVVQDTDTDSLYGEGLFLSRSGNPAGPWKRVADSDQLANSDSALVPPNPPDLTSYFPGVQADYNQYVLADPRNPRHVYLGLEEVYETTSAGAHWNTVGPYWNYDISCDSTDTTPYNCPRTTHPDQHAGYLFHGRFFAGNDGGVWSRPIGKHTRGHWTVLNQNGLDTLQYYSASVGDLGSGMALWGGLQDNGETYWATGMRRVEQAFTGDGGDTIVDPSNGNRAVEEYVDQDMYMTTDGASDADGDLSVVPDRHRPAGSVRPEPAVHRPDHHGRAQRASLGLRGQYVWDDHKAWNTVCAGATCDWKVAYDTGEGHQITALADSGRTTYAAWCGPCNPATGDPFARGMATNYGGSWHELGLHGVPNRYITSIAVDPGNAAHIYISVGSYSRRWIPTAGYGHVFESKDGGATWRNLSGNLPDAPVYAVALDGGKLIAGTEVGVFAAGGSHRHWTKLGRNLPNVTVWDLAVSKDGKTVVAGTHGRGQWTLRVR